MKKHLLILSSVLIMNVLSAGDVKPLRKVIIVRASKPASQKNLNADEVFFVNVADNGAASQRIFVSKKEIMLRRLNNYFHFPSFSLPLQKE